MHFPSAILFPTLSLLALASAMPQRGSKGSGILSLKPSPDEDFRNNTSVSFPSTLPYPGQYVAATIAYVSNVQSTSTVWCQAYTPVGESGDDEPDVPIGEKFSLKHVTVFSKTSPVQISRIYCTDGSDE